MRFSTIFLALCIVTFLLSSTHSLAIEPDKSDLYRATEIESSSDKDVDNVYKDLLHDETDDLMENHPADNLYNYIWTCERLNPYKIPIDSLPDSINIDFSTYHSPVKGHITSHFGSRRYRFHYGTDVKLFVGDTVVSSFSGKVRIIDYDRRGYGHYVVVRHDNGLETVYAHLSKVLVKLDEVVEGGQPIALGGNTGRSTGSHLHYEMRILGNPLNPAKLVDFENGVALVDNYLITKADSFYYQKELAALSEAKYYRIKSGDTLSRIAVQNGTTVTRLCQLNGINRNKLLQIGQRLRVR